MARGPRNRAGGVLAMACRTLLLWRCAAPERGVSGTRAGTSPHVKEKARITKLSVIAVLSLMVLQACATTQVAREIKQAPMPPKYVDVAGPPRGPAPGSLYAGNAGIFSDHRARGLNDLVTIQIIENNSGSKTADTSTERSTDSDYSWSKLFGLPSNLGVGNFLGSGADFDPGLKGGTETKHEGKGSTTRKGKLNAYITAKVVEVLPNGNFVLEARKETLINNENQILVLQGLVRPQDISAHNVVQSTFVADARIFFTGVGVIDDKQSPGWLTRVMDNVWPF